MSDPNQLIKIGCLNTSSKMPLLVYWGDDGTLKQVNVVQTLPANQADALILHDPNWLKLGCYVCTGRELHNWKAAVYRSIAMLNHYPTAIIANASKSVSTDSLVC